MFHILCSSQWQSTIRAQNLADGLSLVSSSSMTCLQLRYPRNNMVSNVYSFTPQNIIPRRYICFKFVARAGDIYWNTYIILTLRYQCLCHRWRWTICFYVSFLLNIYVCIILSVFILIWVFFCISGIFTVAGIVDSFVYHGHKALRKKMEIGKLG